MVLVEDRYERPHLGLYESLQYGVADGDVGLISTAIADHDGVIAHVDGEDATVFMVVRHEQAKAVSNSGSYGLDDPG